MSTAAIIPIRTEWDDVNDLRTVHGSKLKQAYSAAIVEATRAKESAEQNAIIAQQKIAAAKMELDALLDAKEAQAKKNYQKVLQQISPTAIATLKETPTQLQLLQQKLQDSLKNLASLGLKLALLRNSIPPAAKAIDEYTTQRAEETVASFRTSLDAIFSDNTLSDEEKNALESQCASAEINRATFHERETMYLHSVAQGSSDSQVTQDVRSQKSVVHSHLVQDEMSLMFKLTYLLKLKAELKGEDISDTKAIFEASKLVAKFYTNTDIQRKYEELSNAYDSAVILKAAQDLNADRAEGGITFYIREIRIIKNDIQSEQVKLNNILQSINLLMGNLKGTQAEVTYAAAKNTSAPTLTPKPQTSKGQEAIINKGAQTGIPANNTSASTPTPKPQYSKVKPAEQDEEKDQASSSISGTTPLSRIPTLTPGRRSTSVS